MALPKADHRKNPPGMLRYLGKVDLFKTLRHKLSPDVQGLFRRFPVDLPAGSPAVDFTLRTASGDTVSVGDYRGKQHVVLEFGSIT